MKKTHYVVLVNHPESLDKHYFFVPMNCVNLSWPQFKELIAGLKPYSEKYSLTPARTSVFNKKETQIYPNGNMTMFHYPESFGEFILAITTCSLHKIVTRTIKRRKLQYEKIYNGEMIIADVTFYQNEYWTFFKGACYNQMYEALTGICVGIAKSNCLFARGYYEIEKVTTNTFNIYECWFVTETKKEILS